MINDPDFVINEDDVYFPEFGYSTWVRKGRFVFNGDSIMAIKPDNQGSIKFFSSLYPYELKHAFDPEYATSIYNRLVAYTYRPLDALQALKDGYGHVIMQRQTTTTPIISVAYLLDEIHEAQALRDRIISEWDQLSFGYAIGLVFNDVFYDKNGSKILRYQDPSLADRLFETEDQAWEYAASIADKAHKFADAHPELFASIRDTPASKQKAIYDDLMEQPRVMLPILDLMNYRIDDGQPRDLFQKGKGFRITQIAYPSNKIHGGIGNGH